MAEAGRVITGSAGGLRLLAPGEGTRPIADKVKQSLFASLESELDDAWGVPFLDLFAGSGSCGIEALSRGAPTATFVEDDAGAARTIAENLRRTHLADHASVVRRDAPRWLEAGRPAADEPFGIVIVDPPYKDTALLAVVGYAELTLVTRQAASTTKAFFTFYAAAGVLYLALSILSTLVFAWLERRARRGQRPVQG